MNNFTPIPSHFAAEMAAAARRETAAERAQRKTMAFFALIAVALGALVYLVW